MRRLLLVLGVLAVLAVAGVVGGYLWVESTAKQPALPGDVELLEFEVPKGATLDRAGKMLEEAGLIKDLLVWRAYVRLHPGFVAKAGKHKLSRAMSIQEILNVVGGNPLAEDIPVTMVEGWRLRDFDAHLAARELIQPGQLIAAASDLTRFTIPFEIGGTNLEGYLYPETYMVPKSRFDVNKLLQRQIDTFNEKFVAPHKDEILKSGRTLHQLVVMASMLEREEPKPDTRPMVAGILYKRLDAKTPLGVDATSHYGLEVWSDRAGLLAALRNAADPYNTRLKVGLPPSPIGAPSLPSLVAALRPKKSDYWYYLHDKDQNIRPAKTADDHEANRKKYNVY